MKSLTNEMVRLCEEIGTSHRSRRSFIRNQKRDVARKMKEFRHARFVMACNNKAERTEFVRGVRNMVSNLKKNVSAMRQNFADDIEGARRAWFGRKA